MQKKDNWLSKWIVKDNVIAIVYEIRLFYLAIIKALIAMNLCILL